MPVLQPRQNPVFAFDLGIHGIDVKYLGLFARVMPALDHPEILERRRRDPELFEDRGPEILGRMGKRQAQFGNTQHGSI